MQICANFFLCRATGNDCYTWATSGSGAGEETDAEEEKSRNVKYQFYSFTEVL